MSEKHWYKLDNSAKIMPSMTNSLNTNVFRLTCSLKSDVNPAVLDEALSEALEEFPMYKCTMKSGLFWHYLETSNVTPKVQKESTYPCAKMDGELLFRLTYYKRRINLEVYHVLADGTGAMEFLKYIVACYLDRIYGLEMHGGLSTASEYAKASDGFSKFDKASHKIRVSKNKPAYKFKFPRKEDTVPDVIEVHVSANKVKSLAHEHGATVTVYLAAVLVKSIIKCARVKDLKRPIGITVPIDLRGVFPSETTRNFFYTICIQYTYDEQDDLDDIIALLKGKFEKNFSKENLQMFLDSYMVLEKFLLIRIIPNMFKNLILSLIVGARNKETMTLSNMGVIHMPSEYEEYIEGFSGYMSSTGLHLTVMSYKDEMVLGFTTHYSSNEVEREMVKFLEAAGVDDVRVVSNKGR